MSAPTVNQRRVTVSTPSDREFRTERIFDATRDRVWRAMTERELVAQWWGRGNKLDIVEMELVPGGRWRFVEHHAEGTDGFEGRYREIVPMERLVMTFSWDGMPAHVLVETVTLEDAGEGRTRVVTTSLFHTTEERDGMMNAGMESGLNESYWALDRVLAAMQ